MSINLDESNKFDRRKYSREATKTQILRGQVDRNKEEFIYPDDNINDELDLIKRMHMVPKCSILESGLRLTFEKVKFFYCSCDPNKMYQICESCAYECHKSNGHTIKEQPPAYIKCSCGEKVHNVSKNDRINHIYKAQCFFNELAEYSQLNKYYLNPEDESICLFCNVFCNDEKEKNKLMLVESSFDVPACKCSHDNHYDIKIMYSLINLIGSSKKYNTDINWGLKQIQFVNLIFKSKESYENIYSDLNNTFSSSDLLDKTQYILTDKKIHLTNFFYAISNFSNLSKAAKGLNYFTFELLNLTPFTDKFIYAVLSSKFEDTVSFWTFLTAVFQGFKNITLAYYSKSFPKFKMFDLENMSSLQRLTLLNRNKYGYSLFLDRYFNSERNLNDLLIEAIKKLNLTRFSLIEAYDVLSSIISILRYNASFYLFSTTQMIKLCEELDKIFANFSKIRKKPKYGQIVDTINEKESTLFLKIVKILHIFIYNYNDNIVLKSLNSEEEPDYENSKFLHDKTELGRCIFRINMKILHITSLGYSVENKESYPLLNKILRYGTQILNLFSNSIDTYVISLKKNFNSIEGYMEILRDQKMSKETQDSLNFLNRQTDQIERLFELYANLGFNKFSLISQIKNAIEKFFSFFQYVGDIQHLSTEERDRSSNFSIMNDENDNFIKKIAQNKIRSSYNLVQVKIKPVEKIPIDPKLMKIYRNLLNQSNFIFSVTKLFNLVDLDIIEDKLIIKQIYQLIWFYIKDNPDNAIIVLSHNIFDSFNQLHYTFANKNFELYLQCIKLISSHADLGFSKHLIKKLSNYLINLPDSYEEKYVCLNYFLKILDIILHDVKSLNYDLTIVKMKTILKCFFSKYNIFNDFVKFLIKITEDVLYGKYDYDDIEDFEEKFEDSQNLDRKVIFYLSENKGIENLKKFTIYNSLVFNIFFLMLKITNKIFDSSNIEERLFLGSIFKKDQLIFILKNKSLNLNIRTEIIKFFRRCYLDIYASDSRDSLDQYIRAFIKQMDETQIKHRTMNSFPSNLYSFFEDLIKVSDIINTNLINLKSTILTNKIANPHMNKFDKEIHEFILSEVVNYKNNISSTGSNTNNKNVNSALKNYFEHGLMIPISLYMKKIFSIVNDLTGDEFLKVYELFNHILNIKKFLLEQNMLDKILFCENGEEDSKLSEEEQAHNEIMEMIFNDLKGYNDLTSNLVTKAITKMNLSDVSRDLYKIKKRSFSAFDYTNAHNIIDSHSFSMLQKPSSINLNEVFSKINDEEEYENFGKSIIEIKEKITNKDQIKLYKIAFLYQKRKGNLESDFSSLGQGLPEICIEYETTYRNLLLKYLIFLLTKDSYLKEHFSVSTYFILFRLLQYHTGEIQSELERILEEEQNKKQEENEKRRLKSLRRTFTNKKIKNEELQNEDDLNDDTRNDNNRTNNNNNNYADKADNKLGFMNIFGDHLLKKLIKIFILDFNPRDCIYNSDYIEAYNIIKVFKFMCEEHNNFFQGSLIKKLTYSYNFQYDNNINRAFSEKINFYDLLLLVLNNILVWSNWGKMTSNEDYNLDHYFDLFSAIVELLIEIIQGNTVENLSYLKINKIKEEDTNVFQIYKQEDDKEEGKLNKTALQIFVENINKGLLFQDGDSNSILYSVRTQLMTFLLTILEEKNCSSDLKEYIIESLSINKVITSINNTLKIYFLQTTQDDPKWSSYRNKFFNKRNIAGSGTQFHKNETNKSNKDKEDISKDYKLFKFDDQLYTFFYDQYFVDDDGFPGSSEFEFTNTLYRYIKLISIPPYEIDEASILINRNYEIKVEVIIDEMNNANTDQDGEDIRKTEDKNFNLISQKGVSFDTVFCEQYFIVKFFETITQMVEVYTEDQQNSTVIFTVMPNIQYLSEDSKNEFLNNVNRENQYTKLYDLIRNVDYFKEEIAYNFSKSSSSFYNNLKNIDFKLVQFLMFLVFFGINVLIFLVSDGDERKIFEYDDGTTPPALVHVLPDYANNITNPQILWERNNLHYIILLNSGKWSSIYWALTFAAVLICSVFITFYLIIKVPLQYEIELIKYMELHSVKREEISYKTKVNILLSDVIIGKDQINSLLFMAICGLIAISFTSGTTEIFYSTTLLAIININPTLKNITVSVKLKYKELLSTLLLTFIIIYSYSSIGFFWFQSRFDAVLEMNEHDGYCESLMFCFLTHSNGGFRIEGGIGEFLHNQKYSFERDPLTFAARLFYDFISFCIVNILMRELVFGIIIETFRDLRIEEQHYDHDKRYICFICGVTKDELEKDRIDFVKHCDKDHNIWNYINYMIRLKFSDPQDLNAINSYTLDQIDKKYTNWIPLYKNKKNSDKSEEREENDEDLNLDMDKYNENHHDMNINEN